MSKLSRERREYEEHSRRHTHFQATYEQFEQFLIDHPKTIFDMDSPDQCAGAECCGLPLSETYCGPEWFNAFQRKVKGGRWSGRELLSALHDVPRPGVPKTRMRQAKKK